MSRRRFLAGSLALLASGVLGYAVGRTTRPEPRPVGLRELREYPNRAEAVFSGVRVYAYNPTGYSGGAVLEPLAVFGAKYRGRYTLLWQGREGIYRA